MFNERLGYFVLLNRDGKVMKIEYDCRSKFTNVNDQIIYYTDNNFIYCFVETEDSIEAINKCIDRLNRS